MSSANPFQLITDPLNNARRNRWKQEEDMSALIQRQEEAARMQQEKLARNQRNTKARSRAVETRSAALRSQRKSRSAARPRSGTVLTGGSNIGGSILGGTGRTSIIGG